MMLVYRDKRLFAGLGIILLLFVICLMLTTRLIIEERQMRKDMAVEEARREAKLLVDAGQGSRAADKYNEALELQNKLFGLEQPRAAELLGEAVSHLVSLARIEDAHRLLMRYYIPPQMGPNGADWLRWRAVLFARQGRWREARDDAAVSVKIRPDYVEIYHGLGSLLVAEKNVETDRQVFTEKIDR